MEGFLKRLRLLRMVLKNTKADKILFCYLIFVFADAALIWILEPSITTYGEALWYCYAVISTAGFGDVVTTALLPRILSVVLTVYSVLVIAVVTGVVVNFYTQVVNLKNSETFTSVMDKLENLPELSKEELADLSARVKKLRNK